MNIEGYERYVGQVFDNRYRLLKTLGVGGMSVVFEAYDLLEKRTVALKMLRDDIASDAQQVKRFVNESRAVAMLSHPNIVKIYNISFKLLQYDYKHNKQYCLQRRNRQKGEGQKGRKA